MNKCNRKYASVPFQFRGLFTDNVYGDVKVVNTMNQKMVITRMETFGPSLLIFYQSY